MRGVARFLSLFTATLFLTWAATGSASAAPGAAGEAVVQRAAEPRSGVCGIAGGIGLGGLCDDAAGAVGGVAGNLAGGGADVAETVGEVGDAVGQTMEFLSDPLYYLASAAQDGAHSLATEVLPAMQSALQPDLSLEWWTDAYMVTFALAILMWLMQLLWAFAQTARGQLGSDGLAGVIGERTPLFFLGALFGPAVGVFALQVTGALTRSIIEIFLGDGTADGASASGLGELIQSTDPDQMPGKDFVALILFSVMALGLLFVMFTLAIMLVTLYLSGIAFPLVWSWVTNPQHAAMGWKVVHVWAGILLAQPLLFLMLGGAIRLASSALLEGQIGGTSDDDGDGLATMVALLVAIVALWMAAATPTLLMKFAPLTPSDSGGQGVGMRDLAPAMGALGGSLASASGRLRGGGGGSRSGGGGGLGGTKGDPSGGRALENSLRSTGHQSGPGPDNGPGGGTGRGDDASAGPGGINTGQGGGSRGGSSESGTRSMGKEPGSSSGGTGSQGGPGPESGGADQGGRGEGEQGLVGVSTGPGGSRSPGNSNGLSGSGGRHSAPAPAARPSGAPSANGGSARRAAAPGAPPLPTPRNREDGQR
ncbi:hypothetical protein [Nocardioides sp. ChNu-99]|uniref:hypothetical protein n=1 Tax=Nocardioides sp. ChNu-99 TaxID=2839897 RepID=UPI0024056FFE|nr:hypothetical protein [Nocardioides sp. ChNu-99]MDF9716465.1 hypothetical protein [Nocardioides sp. ChNu-99]